MCREKAGVAVVYEDGKPTKVILDIGEYEELLARVEDIDDLKLLREIRRKPLSFRTLDEFLEAYPNPPSSPS